MNIDTPTMCAAPTTAATNAGFSAFWSLYPRKLFKLAAMAAWKRLAPDAALANTILSAVVAQRDELTCGGLEFCPYAVTWLNGERWNDEMPIDAWTNESDGEVDL